MKRRIAVITGNRAEFGVIAPIISAIKKSKKLELQLIVTGVHLLKEHGYTINDVKKLFPIKSVVPIFGNKSSLEEMSKALGRGVIRFTDVFKKLKPDMAFVTGDRIEQLAAAVSAAILNIPIAHYVGGERTKGHIDESIRHSITKFAHIHFAKTEESKKRIIKLGENPKNIFVVGFSGLDTILRMPLLEKEAIAGKINLDVNKPIIVLLQHPISTQADLAGWQMEQTMKAISDLKMQTVVIYPNSDAGSEDIISVIKKYEKKPFIMAVKSLPYKEYLSLLRISKVLVGNSSGYTVEALPFKLPVVNMGVRQQGRERTGNIIDVDYNTYEIKRAIEKSLYNEMWLAKIKNMKNPFGDGKTSQRIVKILENIKLNENILQKQITY